MATLHDRLAELAQDAPTGGAPAAELWARGQRAHRLRVGAIAATVVVVVGAGVGVRLAGGDDDRAEITPAGTGELSLPIEYPVGEELPDLGKTPGPLAAVWLVPRGSRAPEVVGLVAETGIFGTLPFDLPGGPVDPDYPVPAQWASIALSPDGRRVVHNLHATEYGLVVRDLVTGGEHYSPRGFETRGVGTWVDSTHLVGHVAGGSDADGWVWQPGRAPELVDYWAYAEEWDLFVSQQGSGPRPWGDESSCTSPALLDGTEEHGELTPGWGYVVELPVLCDVLGIIGSETLLGHRRFGDDDNRTVVALDLDAAGPDYDDPDLTRAVVSAEAPERVSIASELIGDALDAEGGAS